MATEKQDEAARRYIDQIQEINGRYGFGGPISKDAYEAAVSAAARAAAPLVNRSQQHGR